MIKCMPAPASAPDEDVNLKASVLFGLSGLWAGLFLLFPALALAHEPPSHLGVYGATRSYCGHGAIPQDVTDIPWVGCFLLSPGHSASGTIAGHLVQVSVDESGTESFLVDAQKLSHVFGHDRPTSGTNLPDVRGAGGDAGYAFCNSDIATDCPSQITVFSRNTDKTVLLTALQCLPPDNHICVSNKEMWDYQNARRR
jgi:hypothetical protein